MERKGLGWVPDYPDVRDVKLSHCQAQQLYRSRIQNSDPSNESNYLAAVFPGRVLSYGSQGEEVEEIQNHLKRLGYFTEEVCQAEQGFFGKITEAAIEKFQKQQMGACSGVVSAIIKAELAGLVDIAKRASDDREILQRNDYGPGVIYLQLQLQTYFKESGDSLRIVGDNANLDKFGVFGKATKEAVIKFQTINGLARDAEVGPKTKEKLREQLKKLRDDLKLKPFKYQEMEFSAPPFSKRTLKMIAGKLLGILLKEQTPEDIMKACGGHEFIYKYLRLKYRSDQKLLGQNDQKLFILAISPIADVIARLTFYLNLPESSTLKEAVSAAYSILQQVDYSTGFAPEYTGLLNQIDWLERGKGYISSIILQPSKAYGRDARGATVTYLQERLRAFGYYHAPTTGFFEKLTEEAVKRFQKNNHLEADGIVGFRTIERLDRLKNESFYFVDQFMLTPNLQQQITEGVVCRLNDLDFLSQYTEKEDIAEDDTKKLNLLLQPIVQPIVKVIAQMIAPIGKHSNLSKAVEQGFEMFRAIAQVAQLEAAVDSQQFDKTQDSKKYYIKRQTLKQWQEKFQTALQLTIAGRAIDLSKLKLALDEFKPLVIAAMNVVREQLIDEFKKPFVQFINAAIYQELHTLCQAQAGELLLSIQSPFLTVTGLEAEELTIWLQEFCYAILDGSVSSPTRLLTSDRSFIRLDPLGQACLQVPVTTRTNAWLSKPISGSSVYLALPTMVDLSLWCTPVEDQGTLNACTAHAAVALVEFFEKKHFGKSIDASRRFLYKTARNLMHRQGDTGASVRETMKAMVLFGIPPEEYCPYDEAKFDEDPSAFCYAFAQNYQTITYFRLDDPTMSTEERLVQVKAVLAAGLPCMFGFTAYDSIRDELNPPGHIPFPCENSKAEGGHAVIAVGYSDYKRVKNDCPGALLIKNSWGVSWGDRGYGWLPYDYVLKGLARDWWSLIRAEWVDTQQFGLGMAEGEFSNIGEDGRSNTAFP